MAHDVFISYSFADQKDAEQIVNKLTHDYGISCWICTRDIAKGDMYKREITDAIENSGVVVLIQSKNAVESDQIPREISIALEEEKKIIPFRIDTAKLKHELRYDLAGVEYIDATVPTMEQRIYDLARSVSNATGKPLKTDLVTEKKSVYLKSTRITCSEIFAGRDALLEQIHTAFEDRNVVFLHGMGGIGKSELARQYWKKQKSDYDTVVFARYDGDLAALIADDTVFCVAGAGRKTQEGDVLQSDEAYARDKLQLMKVAGDAHTLIILDNFDVAVKEDPFFEELVRGGDYRVLVTTRCEPDTKKYHVIHVGEIDDAMLQSLFIAYANPQKTIIELDDPDFPELLHLTNRHTYTLELVAKCMEENDDIDYLSEMLDYLKENGFHTLHRDGYDSICSLFRLTVLSQREKYFLRCLALMPPGGISQKLFKKWIGQDFSVRSRLVDLSLVKINGETRTILLHPVVREVILNELQPGYENCKAFIDRCAMVGEDAIPLMWGLSYAEKAVYLDCFISLARIMDAVTQDNYSVFVNMSYMFNYVATYTQAIALQERILAFASRQFGERSLEVMLIYNRIGWKTYNAKYFARALPYYRKVADWFVEHPDYTSRESHDAIRSCATLYHRMYREDQNPEYLRQAFAYTDKALEYGQRMVEASAAQTEQFQIFARYQVDCLSRNYLQLYMEEEKYDLVEKYLEKYREITENFARQTGVPNADSADCRRLYARYQYQLGNYREAREALEQSYRQYLEFFPETNTYVIEQLGDLARCCMKLGDQENAGKYLAIAIENARLVFTKDHPMLLALLALQKELCEREVL